ncbi:MAG: 3-deoxy-D-manno-octulosonic acid transferase [Deltaproteobacteria bacterium]|nr:3-deoxy-D-manno-octulosonic acid transferase [Deltaproteobacteria bacterium]MBW2118108.1 3-deoxy-D-manno-octulosonic acid transferase [Deltaproteobacteria bacterium]MBW2344258.1 3-deoxy-D-manno-octulosonic acid transferase [Deltaproteobacteria bacterium]
MTILYATYLILTTGLFIFLSPYFWIYTRITGRYRDHIEERLGFVPDKVIKRLSGSPRIWIHAVSLGEIKAADAIIEALSIMMPGCSIILSTSTEHGRDLATKTLGGKIPVVYAPVDFIGSVCRALAAVRPDIIVFLETEIWPAWLYEARRMGIKTALINGRISVRSIKGYLKLHGFFRKVLNNFDVLSMITEGDADRIMAMGADPQRLKIHGNAKYDQLTSLVDSGMETKMRETLNLNASQPVFVAGSTRDGEEKIVLNAYEKILKEFPDTILIIVPRHIKRTAEIGSLVERHGFTYQLRTDFDGANTKRTARVVIINTFGELFKIYSVGTILFCGASLVPLGGQNVLEPAIWGNMVFYGPSMENFSDARALLEKAKAGIQVSGHEELAERAIWFLRHPEELNMAGERARVSVLKNQGAAKKHAEVIKKLMARV